MSNYLDRVHQAWLHSRHEGYIPWGNRLGLSALFSAMMLLASWSGSDPWWVGVLAALPWPGLVILGIWLEVDEQPSKRKG